jgi:hypothetical protein
MIWLSLLDPIRFIKYDILWNEIEWPLKIVQSAAIMEVLHAMIGIVKSPFRTTFLQGNAADLYVVAELNYIGIMLFKCCHECWYYGCVWTSRSKSSRQHLLS